MANGLVVHIVVGEEKHTEVLTQDRIRIGAGVDCDLRLFPAESPSATALPGMMLELARTNGHYHIKSFDQSLGITHNGVPVKTNTEIEDGDEVLLGSSEFALQFYPVRSLPAVIPGLRPETNVAPFIGQAAMESAATARRDDAKIFLREFTRELVREINLSTKLVTLAIALALVGGLLYLGFAVVKELQQSRRLIDQQRTQLTQMKDQVDKTNEHLSDLGRSNKEIRDSLSLAVKLRSDYGRGVCLISGSYIFVEQGTNRPLRYPEAHINDEGAAIQNGNAPLPLTAEGKGTVAEFEFVGTGFYAGDGFVLTNKHVVQPWIADERAKSMSRSVGGQPRLKRLVAFFPDHKQPVTLKFKMAAPREDLAACTIDLKEIPEGIPVLPLEGEPDAVAVGKAVVMMGYPSGPDRLLALMDETEARGVQARYGSLEALLGYLSEKNHIQPLTTQGHITDLDVRRIVYDARTAEGGSGAPLFGPSGRVIGVNFAVFTENTASNFAIPVRFAIALLQRANWKAPEPTQAADQNAGSGASQPNARATTATTNAQR